MLRLGSIDLPHEFISSNVKNIIADKPGRNKAVYIDNISLRWSFPKWAPCFGIYLPNVPLNKPIFVIHDFFLSVFYKLIFPPTRSAAMVKLAKKS